MGYGKLPIVWEDVARDLLPEVMQKNLMTPKNITTKKLFEKAKDIKLSEVLKLF